MASRFNFVPDTYAGQFEDRGIKIGDQFSQDIWYRDDLSGVVNLSGYTGSMSIRDQANSDVDILVLSTANSRMVLTSGGDVTADPNILLNVDASDTLLLSGETSEKFYDLRLIPSNPDETYTLMEGKFKIRF